MPTFDFQCRDCNHLFEYNRPFGSQETPSCPECGGTDVQKLITPPAIHFKGEGFYKTDSQKEQKREVEKRERVKNEKKGKVVKSDRGQKDSKKDKK